MIGYQLWSGVLLAAAAWRYAVGWLLVGSKGYVMVMLASVLHGAAPWSGLGSSALVVVLGSTPVLC